MGSEIKLRLFSLHYTYLTKLLYIFYMFVIGIFLFLQIYPKSFECCNIHNMCTTNYTIHSSNDVVHNLTTII